MHCGGTQCNNIPCHHQCRAQSVGWPGALAPPVKRAIPPVSVHFVRQTQGPLPLPGGAARHVTLRDNRRRSRARYLGPLGGRQKPRIATGVWGRFLTKPDSPAGPWCCCWPMRGRGTDGGCGEQSAPREAAARSAYPCKTQPRHGCGGGRLRQGRQRNISETEHSPPDARPGMHWKGGGGDPPPLQGPSLCQAALSLTTTVSPSGSCNQQ